MGLSPLFFTNVIYCQKVEVCRAGLQASLLVRHPESKELFVNFDSQILTMIRETECLSRMGLEIPLLARTMRARQGEYKDIVSKLQVYCHFFCR
jgi:dynein heavy chain